MFIELLLKVHVVFGVFGLVFAVMLFIDVLNEKDPNVKRTHKISVFTAASIWISYIVGGFWYVKYYATEKALILAGPMPMAHSFFMEFKEHLFFNVLLLATLLPIISASGEIYKNDKKRKYFLILTALVVVLVFLMEGMGSMITMGVKSSLLNSLPH